MAQVSQTSSLWSSLCSLGEDAQKTVEDLLKIPTGLLQLTYQEKASEELLEDVFGKATALNFSGLYESVQERADQQISCYATLDQDQYSVLCPSSGTKPQTFSTNKYGSLWGSFDVEQAAQDIAEGDDIYYPGVEAHLALDQTPVQDWFAVFQSMLLWAEMTQGAVDLQNIAPESVAILQKIGDVKISNKSLGVGKPTQMRLEFAVDPKKMKAVESYKPLGNYLAKNATTLQLHGVLKDPSGNSLGRFTLDGTKISLEALIQNGSLVFFIEDSKGTMLPQGKLLDLTHLGSGDLSAVLTKGSQVSFAMSGTSLVSIGFQDVGFNLHYDLQSSHFQMKGNFIPTNDASLDAPLFDDLADEYLAIFSGVTTGRGLSFDFAYTNPIKSQPSQVSISGEAAFPDQDNVLISVAQYFVTEFALPNEKQINAGETLAMDFLGAFQEDMNQNLSNICSRE